MEFLVRFETHLPDSMGEDERKRLKEAERARAMQLREPDYVTCRIPARTGARPSAVIRRLAGHGYTVAPHVPARLVRDKQHLYDVVTQLDEAGADGIFVIAGDAATTTTWARRLKERGIDLPTRKGLPGADQHLSGFHLFAFNELEKTESWRRALPARLGAAPLS
ncbi:hypothetical protein AB0J42_32690 [Nonomuraea sp. NPDC049649]|uniref:hypothetical protein n=1 Tax=Nonomuraea sp. NPDC049649 TaxID=3155776 RepID=UPI00342260B7